MKLYNAGTNVAEPVFSKFDISNDTLLKQFSYNTSLFNASTCPGTHSAYYSRQNKQCVHACNALAPNPFICAVASESEFNGHSHASTHRHSTMLEENLVPEPHSKS